jgi:hypothetical protein
MREGREEVWDGENGRATDEVRKWDERPNAQSSFFFLNQKEIDGTGRKSHRTTIMNR